MKHIALAGNPNSGKSTLFNALTGSTAFVGNWPGVTVEKREGKTKINGETVAVMDLPGIYSLSPYSNEEIISRDYILHEKPEVVVNIVDASNLERNLYLTTQLLELGVPVVVALNMMDIVKKKGEELSSKALAKKLGCPVCEISAINNTGLPELKETVNQLLNKPAAPKSEFTYEQKVNAAIAELKAVIADSLMSPKSTDFYAVKLLSNDEAVSKEFSVDILQKAAELRASLEKDYDDEMDSIITEQRYHWIQSIMPSVVVKRRKEKLSLSDKIDRVLTNKWLALPIFFAIIYAIYWVCLNPNGLGKKLVGITFGWVFQFLFFVQDLLTNMNVAPWLVSLVCDGVIFGVGIVVAFIPYLMTLFVFLAILEECGYMARVTFIMDRVFRRFGLSGKSFIPMLLGTGCTVQAVAATRTIENENDRRMTIFLTPFMPCATMMPSILIVVGLITSNPLVPPLVYLLAIIFIIAGGIFLKHTLLKGEPAPFVMELPEYKLPRIKNMKKLKKILLVNWLYFSKQIIYVDDINFITGKNGSGKSTIIDALQIVLLGETNSRNFNQAANEKSQRTLERYLRADMDEHSPKSRRGKDFSSFIACEFWDDVHGTKFVAGIAFDCRSDGAEIGHFFLYDGEIPESGFVIHGIAMPFTEFRKSLKEQYGTHVKFYDTQKEYQTDLLAKWNVHSPQVMRMLKKAVPFRPIADIQKFITENICDVQDRPDINAMQQNIRDYQRHEQLAQRQEDKLIALQHIHTLFREMQQTIDRYKQQRFLVLWSEKEELAGQIQKHTLEKEDCAEKIHDAKIKIQEQDEEIIRKDKRKNELITACSQSTVAIEQNSLEQRKQKLQLEQQSLMGHLQRDSLEIKREVSRLTSLCSTIEQWDSYDDILDALTSAVSAVEEAYRTLSACDYTVFSKPIAVFEQAQVSVTQLYQELHTASYKIESILQELKGQKDETRTLLFGLKKEEKPYPKGLHQLQSQLISQLKIVTGQDVPIRILADVLEIPESEEHWRKAVEGYLNTQKFYLLIPPAYYHEALQIYDRIKADFSRNSFGLVDVGKLREHEQIISDDNSLAQKIETQDPLARSYIDYLLGHVICCAHVEELQDHKTSITPEGMIYQGYVARPLKKDLMESAFIGRKAIQLQIEKLNALLQEIEGKISILTPIHQALSEYKNTDRLFTQYFVQSTIIQRQADYLRSLSIAAELDEVDEKLSHLDLFWLKQQQEKIHALEQEIAALRASNNHRSLEIGAWQQTIHVLDYEKLPEKYQSLTEKEDQIAEEFSDSFLQSIGLPRYKQELARLKKASIVHKNFSNQIEKTIREEDSSKNRLFMARIEYANTFNPCSFKTDAMDNEEYDEEMARLSTSELPQYREKIRAARESAMEQFQNDFLAKLKSSIDQVQAQVKSLNKALKHAQFGTDQYLFRVDRNPDYADYYDMIMAPELMEGDQGLFALPFQEKYGPLIQDLFNQLAASDDTQLNARKQSELQQNIERYTDFRTYLKFDLETTDKNGNKQLLSQTLNTKSGGETQTPFYIAVLASFAQLYQVNNLSEQLSNTVRLVVFDEAFNKMDSDRIIESIKLLRKMGLQAIICTPPDKVPDIMPLADRVFLARNEQYQMQVLPYSKEGILV